MPRTDDEIVRSPECRAIRAKLTPLLNSIVWLESLFNADNPNLPSYVANPLSDLLAGLKRWRVEHEKAA